MIKMFSLLMTVSPVPQAWNDNYLNYLTLLRRLGLARVGLKND